MPNKNKTDNYFLTIAKVGNLNRAAELLYVSQPSLTKYIKRIEQRLGTPLFDRSVTPMQLNAAGKLYYEYLMKQNALEEELLTQISELNRMERGTLRLGIPPYSGQRYLPRVLKQFIARYPSVKIDLFEAKGLLIEKALANQDIDLGIVYLPIENDNLHYREIFSEPVLLAVPNPSGADGRLHILDGSIRDFADATFIMPHPEQKLGQIATQLFSQIDFEPKVLFTSQNIYSILSFVAEGLGVGLLPFRGLSPWQGDVLNKITFYRLKELDDDMWRMVALTRKNYYVPSYTEYFIELFAYYGKAAASWAV